MQRLFSAPPEKVLLVLMAMLIGAAVYDVRYRRIPNWLNLTGFVLGILINSAIGPPEAGLIFALKGFAVGFGFYMLLYVVRATGAGDVKMMGAIGALIGAERWFGLFLINAILGGVMAVVLAAIRGRLKRTFFNVGFIMSELKHGRPAYVGREELDVKSEKAMALPRGAVTAIAAIFYIAFSAAVNR
jgi:prepilin peptidase CpaA